MTPALQNPTPALQNPTPVFAQAHVGFAERRNAEGVREFQPRVASTLGSKTGSGINAESVRDPPVLANAFSVGEFARFVPPGLSQAPTLG
jgi:hypothetical protein